MNLRKALDKAKQERQQGEAQNKQHARPSAPSSGASRDQVQSLVYSKSRHVTLDHTTARKNRLVCLFPDSKENDRFKGIRTQITQRMSDKGWRTLMITSALPGEGKSLTSINLAITFAKEKNNTVLLVDGDLRRQKIHQLFGYESNEGLVDFLVDGKPLQELIVWPGVEKLSVISGGRTVEDSTELLASARMKELMGEMKSRYENRYILLESPPILSCPDTAAFSPLVDAIVMVVEAGRTSVEEIKKATRLIPKEKFLGFILNKKKECARDEYATYYSA